MKAFISFIFCILIFNQILLPKKNDLNPNGYNVFYYPNGKISSEGWMKNGKPNGFWKTYYVTGIKKSEGIRKKHLLDSIWLFYNNIGDTIEKIPYRLGLKSGYYEKYIHITDEFGKRSILKSKELYIKNKKEGKSFYFEKTGKLKFIRRYENNRLEGKTFELNEDSLIVTIYIYHEGALIDMERVNRYDKEGNKHGKWLSFFKNGKIREESFYKDGRLDGFLKKYDKKGNLIFTGTYRGDIIQKDTIKNSLNNIKTLYYENGSIKSTGAFINKKPFGIQTFYNAFGNINRIEIYNEFGSIIAKGPADMTGTRQGKWEFYDSLGNIIIKGIYKDGLKYGLWNYYNSLGELIQTGKYLRGLYQGKWSWYKKNRILIKEEEFHRGKNEGIFAEYYGADSIKIIGKYMEGKREGIWQLNIGDLAACGKYVMGEKDSLWVTYFKNTSQLYHKGKFVMGEPDGKHRFYYNNGQLMEEQFYKMGTREKNWKKYDKEGNLKIIISYKKGKEVKINGIKVKY